MYKAELRGKLPLELIESEDVLTSNVFGFLDYADRRVFLRGFLRSLGLAVTEPEAERAELTFWPALDDGTEPDVIIRCGSYYLLVEAKLHSGFGADPQDTAQAQLAREFREGHKEASTEGRTFRLITITAEPLRRAPEYALLGAAERAVWIWTNWQTLVRFLEELPATRGDRMALDLVGLLRSKGLRRFDGFAAIGTAGMPIPVVADRCFFRAASAGAGRRFGGFASSLARFAAPPPAPGPLFFRGHG